MSEHNSKSLIYNLGLTERVLQSELSEHDAEAKVCFSVCGEHFPPEILFVDITEVTALEYLAMDIFKHVH
jgi:hypothetical protein